MSYLSSFAVAALGGGGIIAVTYRFARFAFGLFLPVIREDMTLSAAVTGLLVAQPTT